ncbi:hypothetical protein LDL08_38915 [Nonomuraea glycinis]|uniref:Uncharacterized protein n=1 Tax=Nonomuraea glycinis TaxID=2047744 RepID=A0A918A1L6_9ACTN|nr:hypothetical protein [Nonomuraea glycinis]MCA2182149.1 hypothetical protein [Nonomuraea glycinis]GGP02197.1 hypothetical protein GCM10012278_08470 [Nonomuraea glycinis]
MLNAGSAALADIDLVLLEAIEACLPSGRHIDFTSGSPLCPPGAGLDTPPALHTAGGHEVGHGLRA